MTIERNRINGSWICSTIDNTNTLITKAYYGYTKKEAKDLFLKHLAHLIVTEFTENN